jgi:REP element-mobilizing transposase RayT
MGYISVYVHLVWTTKNMEPLLTKEIRQVVFCHILENARAKGIFVDFIGGYLEHVHCLISLGNDQPISKIIQLIKGESSFWINKNKLTRYKFEWQDDYYGVSVNLNGLNRVREYIKNQEKHHQHSSFQKEYEKFKEKIGFIDLG